VSKEFHTIGKVTPRKDGISKVTGAEKYTSDITLPRMWHARTLRSPHAHAIVKSIDTSAAEAMGAVCLTVDETPKVRYNERLVSVPDKLFKDRFVLPDKLRHVGEAFAAVAAPTEALAEQALRLIKVEYEILPPVIDTWAAMEPDAAPLYDTIIFGDDEEISIKNNIACTRDIEEGDIEKGFAQADLILEQEFFTGGVYHAQLETKGVIVEPEPDGGITVWPTTQSIHNTRILLGQIFDIPLSKINIKKVAIGGTFGSSIQTNSIIPICTALALKARRPIKLLQTREEDWHTHSRYPSIIKLKIGVTRDGTLTAGHMRTTADIGAHNTQAFPYLGVLAGFWVSLYKMPNLLYEGTAVYTNKVPVCAMRGFGAPQSHFAVEAMMDHIAEHLGMDPITLRLKNYIGLGDTFWGQGPTVRSVVKSDGVKELLERGAELINWSERKKPGEQTGRYVTGIGMARGFHTSGTGAPRPGEVIDYSSAFIKINEDGSVDVATAMMDHGGGSLEAIAKIVAEALGVPFDKVGLSPVDTRTTAYDVATHATRGVYVGGGAAYKVAMQVREKLLNLAAQILGGVQPAALDIRPDEALGQGIVYAESVPGLEITVGEVAAFARAQSMYTLQAADSLRQVSGPPAYVAHFVEIEVDTETGSIRTLRTVAGSDAGTVINPDMAIGQLEGGLIQGLGFAFFEDARYDPETGQPLSRGMITDGKIPTFAEVPSVDNTVSFFANTHEPSGPFGAKGIGEAAINPVAAAFSNAVYNALGIRFTELPISPEVVLQALTSRQAQTPSETEEETDRVLEPIG